MVISATLSDYKIKNSIETPYFYQNLLSLSLLSDLHELLACLILGGGVPDLYQSLKGN